MNYLQVQCMRKTAEDTVPAKPTAEDTFWDEAEDITGWQSLEMKAHRNSQPWYHWFNGGRGMYAIQNALDRRHEAAMSRDKKALNQASEELRAIGADMEAERKMTDAKETDWGELLKNKLPSYAAWTAGGALLGRLIAGKKNRLAGYLLGGLAGAAANFARRKSYYGGLINW